MLSLPKRISMKVTAIEEANDVTTMKLDELFGSLRTFKLNLGNNDSKRKSSVMFQSKSDDMPQPQKECAGEENLAEFIALLT